MKIFTAIVLVVATSTARADDQTFVAAIGKHDAKAVQAAIAVPFHAKGLPFKTKACTAMFGGDKTVTEPKLLPRLAYCIAALDLGDYKLEVARAEKIVGLTARKK